jgi:hypothetical protein
MTQEDRTRALEGFGYIRSEAAFLCLAALHSGYFRRRQFRRFAGASRGYRDDLLIEKIISNKHGQVYGSGKKTIVYHLRSRPFYSPIGEPDNRHRRERPPFGVKAKLMAFDYVLANQKHRYLATEEEKVGYFTGELGIRIDSLPRKIYSSRKTESTTDRYFVDKFPIYLSGSSRQLVVSFCYVDEGVIATPGFETYLKQYMALFRALGRFRVIYVATKEHSFRLAEKTFYHFFDPSRRDKTDTNESSRARLLDYFRLEHLYRAEQFELLDAAKLEELRSLRKEFKGEKFESLFGLWRERGEEAVASLLFPETVAPTPFTADFLTYKLDEKYDLFDTSR